MTAYSGTEQESFRALLEKYALHIPFHDVSQKARKKAWEQFVDLGLPSRHTEVYRSIKLRQLFSQNYQLAESLSIQPEQIADAIYPECRHSVLVFVNGHYQPNLSNTTAIPDKVVISTLQEAMRTYGTFLNNQWNKSIKEEKDPFAVLNGALYPNGAFIYIPPKTIIEAPVQVLQVVNASHLLMLMPRLTIFVGAQSQLNLIQSQTLTAPAGYFINQVSELALEENAHVHYTQVLCEEHPAAWHLDAMRAHLKRNAILKSILVTQGGMTVRNDYRITLAGENAEALLNGVWMLADKREAHVNLLVDHQAPHCRSYQLFKGVLNDFSRSSFEGKILVRQAAQKTEAFQLNNNLLLHEHTHASSKPNLEIFADDVKASHGSTVGQLDPDQLFYLKTRGIPESEAKNLLVYGFCEQIVDLISLPSLREEISSRVRRYLTQGME